MTTTAQTLRNLLIRNVDDIPKQHKVHAPHYDSHRARLSEGTAAQKLGATIDVIAPGKRICPYHLHHAQEEMFIILEGSGTLRVAGEMLPLKKGDVIFIPPGPEYPHQIINTSEAPLKYLSISTQEDPEIYEYPDSGKFMAEGSLRSERPFEVIQRLEPPMDYWEGEE
jgi:uncharacterized cupin superfamily protein